MRDTRRAIPLAILLSLPLILGLVGTLLVNYRGAESLALGALGVGAFASTVLVASLLRSHSPILKGRTLEFAAVPISLLALTVLVGVRRTPRLNPTLTRTDPLNGISEYTVAFDADTLDVLRRFALLDYVMLDTVTWTTVASTNPFDTSFVIHEVARHHSVTEFDGLGYGTLTAYRAQASKAPLTWIDATADAYAKGDGWFNHYFAAGPADPRVGLHILPSTFDLTKSHRLQHPHLSTLLIPTPIPTRYTVTLAPADSSQNTFVDTTLAWSGKNIVMRLTQRIAADRVGLAVRAIKYSPLDGKRDIPARGDSASQPPFPRWRCQQHYPGVTVVQVAHLTRKQFFEAWSPDSDAFVDHFGREEAACWRSSTLARMGAGFSFVVTPYQWLRPAIDFFLPAESISDAMMILLGAVLSTVTFAGIWKLVSSFRKQQEQEEAP